MPSKKTRKVPAPAWHPNFRDHSVLPDIRAVRLGFFINLAAVLVILVTGGVLLMNEYQIRSLRTETATLKVRIDREGATNDANIKKSVEFKKLGRNLGEFDAFLTEPVEPVELLLVLAERKPDEVILEAVDLGFETRTEKRKEIKRTVLTIEGTVAGDSRQSTRIFTTFRDQVREMPRLAGRIEELEEYPARDETVGLLTFKLVLKLKAEEA